MPDSTAELWRETDKYYMQALFDLQSSTEPVQVRKDLLKQLVTAHTTAPTAQEQLAVTKKFYERIKQGLPKGSTDVIRSTTTK